MISSGRATSGVRRRTGEWVQQPGRHVGETGPREGGRGKTLRFPRPPRSVARYAERPVMQR